MDLLCSFFAALIGTGLAFVGLDEDLAGKIEAFHNSDPNELFVSKEINKLEKIVILCVVAGLCFVASMRIMDEVHNFLGILKMMICLLGLVGAASFDYREHRIPNFFPTIISVFAVVLLGLGLVVDRERGISYVTTGVLSATVCGLFLVLSAVITKQGIGAGDIKLICAIALIAGVYAIMGTLFFAVVLCSIFGAVALILRKKAISSTVPFGPFLLFGYILTLHFVSF